MLADQRRADVIQYHRRAQVHRAGRRHHDHKESRPLPGDRVTNTTQNTKAAARPTWGSSGSTSRMCRCRRSPAGLTRNENRSDRSSTAIKGPPPSSGPSHRSQRARPSPEQQRLRHEQTNDFVSPHDGRCAFAGLARGHGRPGHRRSLASDAADADGNHDDAAAASAGLLAREQWTQPPAGSGPDPTCVNSNFAMSGTNTATWTITCQNPPSTGTGQITRMGAERLDGRHQLTCRRKAR